MPDQGTLRLTLLDAAGQPAVDPSTNIRIVRISDNRQIGGQNSVKFPTTINFTLPSFPFEQGLVCWVDPTRFRTCHSSIFTLTDGQLLELSPTVFRDPKHWNANFAPWANLDATFTALKQVLVNSASVIVKETGQSLGNISGNTYDSINGLPAILAKTALLNLYAKMHKVPVATGGAGNWFDFVQTILIIGRERFIGIVKAEMWDEVKRIFDNIGQFPDFVRADTSLHVGNIPSPYAANLSAMISIKSNDPHGNLQLTMAKSQDPATEDTTYLVDADIDEDLEFFQHARDLFVHAFSGGTHPFDVHEILLKSYGSMTLGYELV